MNAALTFLAVLFVLALVVLYTVVQWFTQALAELIV